MRRLLPLLIALFAFPAFAEIQIGFEGSDTHGYGYLTHITSRRISSTEELHLWQTLSYRYYEFRASGGTGRLTSPGIAAGVGYRWLFPRGNVTVSPGYEFRRTTRRTPGGFESTQNDQGVVLFGGGELRPNEVTQIDAGASWEQVTDWTSVRAAGKRRVTGGPSSGTWAGIEGGTQGNDDLRAHHLGGVIEFRTGGTGGMAVRAGQSWIEHPSGLRETRPYFSVGYGSRF